MLNLIKRVLHITIIFCTKFKLLFGKIKILIYMIKREIEREKNYKISWLTFFLLTSLTNLILIIKFDFLSYSCWKFKNIII